MTASAINRSTALLRGEVQSEVCVIAAFVGERRNRRKGREADFRCFCQVAYFSARKQTLVVNWLVGPATAAPKIIGMAMKEIPGWESIGQCRRLGTKARWYKLTGTDGTSEFVEA